MKRERLFKKWKKIHGYNVNIYMGAAMGGYSPHEIAARWTLNQLFAMYDLLCIRGM